MYGCVSGSVSEFQSSCDHRFVSPPSPQRSHRSLNCVSGILRQRMREQQLFVGEQQLIKDASGDQLCGATDRRFIRCYIIPPLEGSTHLYVSLPYTSATTVRALIKSYVEAVYRDEAGVSPSSHPSDGSAFLAVRQTYRGAIPPEVTAPRGSLGRYGPAMCQNGLIYEHIVPSRKGEYGISEYMSTQCTMGTLLGIPGTVLARSTSLYICVPCAALAPLLQERRNAGLSPHVRFYGFTFKVPVSPQSLWES